MLGSEEYFETFSRLYIILSNGCKNKGTRSGNLGIYIKNTPKNYPLLLSSGELNRSGVAGLQVETRLPDGTPS